MLNPGNSKSEGKTSVRQLPVGKMQNIREMFENKSEDNVDQKDNFMKGSPVRKPPRPRPMSTIIDKISAPSDEDIVNMRNLLAPSSGVKPRRTRSKSDVPENASAVSKALNMLHFEGKDHKETVDGDRHGDKNLKKPENQTISNTDDTVSNVVLRQTKMFDNPTSDKKRLDVISKPTPPIKPRSRPASASSDGDSEQSLGHAYCSPWDINKIPGMPMSPPPRKPPRTGAHEEYIQVKAKREDPKKHLRNHSYDSVLTTGPRYASVSENEEDKLTPNVLYESVDDIKANEIEKQEDKPSPIYKRIDKPDIKSHNDDKTLFIVKGNSAEKKPPPLKLTRPLRPPPPKSNRPVSVAVDNFTDRVSDVRKRKPALPLKPPSPGNSYTQRNSMEEPVDLDNIKHWDLPLQDRQTNFRKSLSAECLPSMDDDMEMGDPTYVDPVAFRFVFLFKCIFFLQIFKFRYTFIIRMS